MSKTVITLLTDFGLTDPYVGVMKGVIYSINPTVNIVDITHNIPSYNIDVAALIMLISYRYFPKNTIHVCVVDPGVGTKRRGILIRTKNYYFIGPDNGCLYPAAIDDGIIEVYDISNSPYRLERTSYTFHGRDLFAPVAAWLSKGVEPSKLGTKYTGELVKSWIRLAEKKNGFYEATVIYIDKFGNVMTNIRPDKIPWSYGEKIRIETGDRVFECVFERSFGYVGEGELVCYINSWGFLELGVNKGNAASYTGLKVKDEIRVY